jgi:citronellol/citronellal dehydrogenase
MTLRDKTIFITGASRGIGKAIALRAAKDGARVVIAAKTSEAHPRLPGTIHSAAEEVERAGGRALACVVDVRFEEAIRAAVDRAVQTFGGIDVLINNASAISLTGTLDTPPKRFDLMHQVNVRGTFFCSQACLPHLLRAANPHILNLAPPLDMAERWLSPHLAYTMSKFGMSMCTLGMAGEFRDAGVAVNALWPKTVIATAALRNIPAGDAIEHGSRSAQIMADAAHAVVTRPSRERTGQLLIDEDVLREAGVTDFSVYQTVPGADLVPDLFV